MQIKIRKYNRMVVIADCVWHSYWNGMFITPAIKFDKLLNGCWVFNIIWLKLYITFGYVEY